MSGGMSNSKSEKVSSGGAREVRGRVRRKILHMGQRWESKREAQYEPRCIKMGQLARNSVIITRPPSCPTFSSCRIGSDQSPGVWVPKGLDQALLLLLKAGEATGGPSCGGGGALGQGEEPAHPPGVPGPEALDGSGLLPLPATQPGGSRATEKREGAPGAQVLGSCVFS